MFTLHAKLHDNGGAVRSYSVTGHAYSYMIGRGPNGCVLGHVTGLLFCPYVKLFLSLLFSLIDFVSSISSIVLDIEFAFMDVSRE